MSASTAISLETVQRTRDSVRSEHNVSVVPSELEGSAFDRLPKGVYGFTYAPATETPLFARHSYRSYEIHKLHSGAGCIICYVTRADAEALRNTRSGTEITMYPDAHGDATTLVSIPLDRIVNNNYKPVRRDGNAIPLELAPVD